MTVVFKTLARSLQVNTYQQFVPLTIKLSLVVNAENRIIYPGVANANPVATVEFFSFKQTILHLHYGQFKLYKQSAIS